MAILFALPAFAQHEFREIKLTDKTIQNYIKADPDLNDVLEKINGAGDKPDTRLIAELESVALKHGFKSFEELDEVAQTVSFIMTGFDPETGDFIEPRKALLEELNALKEDNSIPENERSELVKELEEAVRTAPDVIFKSNITLVRKHLSELIKLDEQIN